MQHRFSLSRIAESVAIVAALAMVLFAPLAQAKPDLPLSPAPPAPPGFAQCAGCHTREAGKHSFGPSLAGVAGRKAGTAPGYAYSEGLKKSGIVWNAKTLDKWLTGPRKVVPGTKMPFPGIPEAARRQEVVNYLLLLK